MAHFPRGIDVELLLPQVETQIVRRAAAKRLAARNAGEEPAALARVAEMAQIGAVCEQQTVRKHAGKERRHQLAQRQHEVLDLTDYRGNENTPPRSSGCRSTAPRTLRSERPREPRERSC